MGNLYVIVGGQFGSEAKGAVCAALVRRDREDPGVKLPATVVRVAGPNAGHTAYDDEGNAWALRQVPVGMVADPDCLGVIADGSEIDLPVLIKEVNDLDRAGLNVSQRLFISSDCTLLTDAHHHAEFHRDMHYKIGSTAKGIGAARADRIMRTATTPVQVGLTVGPGRDLDKALTWFHHNYSETIMDKKYDQIDFEAELRKLQWAVTGHCTDLIQAQLAIGSNVFIEGTQGYGLGVHQTCYPQTTSSDTRAIDFLAMAGLNPWDPVVDNFEVWMVVRAFPIRVAGNSGPLRNETTWEELGLKPERTTVTHKVRRVGMWDQSLFDRALRANGRGVAQGGAVKVAYAMADQECPQIAGLCNDDLAKASTGLSAAIREELQLIDRRTYLNAAYIGTGPNSNLWFDPLVRYPAEAETENETVTE